MKLQKEWYAKVKQTGFTDIEKKDHLIDYHATRAMYASYYEKGKCTKASLSKDRLIYQESVREYYRQANMFLHSHRFFDDVNKRIWELHTQGYSQVSISKIVTERTLKQSRYIAECLRDVMLNRVSRSKKQAIRKYT